MNGSGSPAERPLVVVACQVLQDMLSRLLPEGLARTSEARGRACGGRRQGQVTFMDYGLHRVPGKMAAALQEILDGIEEPSVVLLGYGLCGNGLKGLRAGKHILVVPRVDDCIALLLGSRRAYIREFEAVPGTYYLSKGWLESGSHPLKEYEEYVPKYGAQQAAWIMDQQYQHYERLVLVAQSQADLEAYRDQALQVARFCERWGMRYEELLGSDEYVQRLVALACTAQADGTSGTLSSGGDFLVIPPGGEIRQEQFMR
jgi:hypothetical protein